MASTDKTATIDLYGRTLWAIGFPATFTGTAVSFENGYDSAVVSNFAGDADYTVSVRTSKIVPVDVRVSGGFNRIVIASNGNEDADRSLVLYLRENV